MKAKRTKPEQGGFVLVVVLCMVLLLSVLLLGFNYEARANWRTVDNFRKSEQALHCARAGLHIAIAAIKDRPDSHTGKLRLSLLSRENTFPVDQGTCSVTITEESGKLNVNFLKDKSGTLDRARIEQVLKLIDLLNQAKAGPRIGYDLVPSIIDWIDSDDQVTHLPFVKYEETGAESRYYGQLKPPYGCKNGALEATEELLLVKGMTPEVFDRVREYVTVYGDGEININHASALALQSVSEDMDAALAQRIVDRRKLKPFESVAELRDLPGMTASIYNTIRRHATIEPANEHYHVISRGRVGPLSCTVVAIVNRNMETENVDVILYREL